MKLISLVVKHNFDGWSESMQPNPTFLLKTILLHKGRGDFFSNVGLFTNAAIKFKVCN